MARCAVESGKVKGGAGSRESSQTHANPHQSSIRTGSKRRAPQRASPQENQGDGPPPGHLMMVPRAARWLEKWDEGVPPPATSPAEPNPQPPTRTNPASAAQSRRTFHLRLFTFHLHPFPRACHAEAVRRGDCKVECDIFFTNTPKKTFDIPT